MGKGIKDLRQNRLEVQKERRELFTTVLHQLGCTLLQE